MSTEYKNVVADSIKSILKEIGENPEREGLLKTPERVAKSLDCLTNGLSEKKQELNL